MHNLNMFNENFWTSNKISLKFVPLGIINQGWQVLDGRGKNRLKPPVKTVRKKQVLDSQNWSKL